MHVCMHVCMYVCMYRSFNVPTNIDRYKLFFPGTIPFGSPSCSERLVQLSSQLIMQRTREHAEQMHVLSVDPP